MRCSRAGGFTLVELLLALVLGGMLSALMLQCLLAEGRGGQRLARLLRERQASQRVLELVRSELQLASVVELGDSGGGVLVPACNLGGRTLVMQFQTPAGVISYTQGAAPDPIWRGEVLMRCGPAYGLDGTWSGGSPLTRVVIDALPSDGGLMVNSSPNAGFLQLELVRRFADGTLLRQRQGVTARAAFAGN
ncbi:prepilin-type N-terminal cleavage/methylation domain-containing protein [Aphanothece stagnina]|uniref:prepilin-type N-terminal cleavage/methylation domain-containing protein n=1 Tax=Aphanothece stagnina TaxID=1004305 RepID=UPI00398E4C79